MRATRKILLLPVLAVVSATVVLFANISLSVASVPATPETGSVQVAAEGTALTIKDWNETAGSINKTGTPTGPNGTTGCPIKR
jgi:hypothetical protein